MADLLLPKPYVLFHSCLLFSNLLLVLDQVLGHLSKLWLQSPPARMTGHEYVQYSLPQTMSGMLAPNADNTSQQIQHWLGIA